MFNKSFLTFTLRGQTTMICDIKTDLQYKKQIPVILLEYLESWSVRQGEPLLTLHDYNLIFEKEMVGQEELESSTSAVSERHSNQLNYWPIRTYQSGKKYVFRNNWYYCFFIIQKEIFRQSAWSMTVSVQGPVFYIKEVIQPHLPVLLPCYDLTPITNPTVGGALLR